MRRQVTIENIRAAISAGTVVHVAGRIDIAGNPVSIAGTAEAYFQEEVADPGTGTTLTQTVWCWIAEPRLAEYEALVAAGAVADPFVPPFGLRLTYSVNRPGSKWDVYSGTTWIRGDTVSRDPSGELSIAGARAFMVALYASAGQRVADPGTITVDQAPG